MFGEDALVNVSVEQLPDGRLGGYIRIRSKTQGIALSLGDKLILRCGRALPGCRGAAAGASQQQGPLAGPTAGAAGGAAGGAAAAEAARLLLLPHERSLLQPPARAPDHSPIRLVRPLQRWPRRQKGA